MENHKLSRSQIEWLIDEFILNRKYREICRLRFIDKLTYEKLAEEVDMSARHVRRITFSCKQTLLEHIDEVPLRTAM